MKVQLEILKYLFRNSAQFKILSEGQLNKEVLFKSIPFKSKSRAEKVLEYLSKGELYILVNIGNANKPYFELRLYGRHPLGRSAKFDSLEELLDALYFLKRTGIFSNKIRIGYRFQSVVGKKIYKLPGLDNISIDHFEEIEERVKGDGAGGRPKRNEL